MLLILISLQESPMLIAFTLILGLITIVEPKPARSESLPKTVWTYQQNMDSNFVHQLCVNRMRSLLQNSRWVLEVITPSNIFIYLHRHQAYKLMLRNYRKKLTFMDEIQIAKLMILQEYGGIWIDPDIIMRDPVDWIHHLQSEQLIQKHENAAYEMVVFSNRETEKHEQSMSNEAQVSESSIPFNLNIILALKESRIMARWVEQLEKQLLKPTTNFIKETYLKSSKIQYLSKLVLFRILHQNQDKGLIQGYKEYMVWNVHQKDYFNTLRQFYKTVNRYLLADFYIKYPLTVIINQFYNSKHFISLKQVSDQLNQILNPNISKLAYLSDSPQFQSDYSKNPECVHFIQRQSIFYSLLIAGTRYQNLVVSLDQKIIQQCSSISKIQWSQVTVTAFYYTLGIISIYLLFKLQKACFQLLTIKIKIFLKPRIRLLFSILKTVKNVIKYSSSNDL